MQNTHIALAKAAINFTPETLLSRLLDGLAASAGRRHPKMIKNLCSLGKAAIEFHPEDTDRKFLMIIGKNDVSLKIKNGAAVKPRACIKGSLKALLDMLEGRADGDKMFFSRDFTFSGDTELVVALRNILDREEIKLADEAAAMAGPFSGAIRQGAVALKGLAERFNKIAGA